MFLLQINIIEKKYIYNLEHKLNVYIYIGFLKMAFLVKPQQQNKVILIKIRNFIS